jgi:hypothetical protein
VTTKLVQLIIFGAHGDDASHLGPGWSGDEPGFRWATGSSSEIWLENPGPGDGFLLELEATPFCRPPGLPTQRLDVEIRGQTIGRSVVAAADKLRYRVPAELLAAKGPVRVILRHADAATPVEFGEKDRRSLAFSFRRLSLYEVSGDMPQVDLEGGRGISIAEMERLTGLPAAEYMLQFESLGDNCEFGLVQRRCGAEPVSLLHFSNFALPNLIRGLRSRFQGIGAIENLEYSLTAAREYVIRDKAFSLTRHTGQREGAVKEENLLEQHARQLKFLARKLVGDLTRGTKILVCKRNVPITDQEILPLHTALNEYGPNTLFWVVQADKSHCAGSVECLMPGLVKGYIDRFAPSNDAHDLSLEVWLDLCVSAQQFAVRREAPSSA